MTTNPPPLPSQDDDHPGQLAGQVSGQLAGRPLRQFIIYECLVGSQAYGLADENSDCDRRGIYLPPATVHWSLDGVPEQIDLPAQEAFYWELEKFLRLALKANPTVLEVLYSPCVEYISPLAQPLVAMRGKFLSKLLYQTFNGYAQSQFQKLGQDLRNKGRFKWKHALHLIRLLLVGIDTLKTGHIHLKVTDAGHKQKLIDIRHGRMAWEHIDAWRTELHTEFEEAFKTTALPDEPDYAAANEYLIQSRRASLDADR